MTHNLTQETAMRLRTFSQMTLDEVALAAAKEPGSSLAQAADVEIKRRVAIAQIEAAKAQQQAAGPLKITAYATMILAAATFALAVVIFSHQVSH
jgi:hypothetical protein